MSLRGLVARVFLMISVVFLGCGGGGGGGSETSVVSLSGDSCSGLLALPTRGLSCLHCNQPQAQEQARQIASVLVDSCLQNVSTNFLVDGTFDFDADFMQELIGTLTQNGRGLQLTFFLANGPAQRRFAITDTDEFGTMINPGDFRNLIFTSETLRAEYTALVSRLRPVVEFGIARGASVVVVPYLEDNLSNSAFREMLSLTQAVLGDLPVTYGRNSCLAECFIGNQGGVPEGAIELLHTIETDFSTAGGIVSNDGFDYSSPAVGENPAAETTLDQLRVLRDTAESRGNNFVLWSAPRQGLPIVPSGIDITFPAPPDRNYQTISNAEKEELINFLRE